MSSPPELFSARDTVLRDVPPTYASLINPALEYRGWWLAQWPEGGEHVLGLLAQDVQEAIHAGHDPDWPLCPEHRDHALFIEPDLGPDPFWVCHRTGLPVAAVGSLA